MEAERIASSLGPRPSATLLVVGIGWGYLPAALIAHGAANNVIFFEPSLDVIATLESTGRLDELRRLGARIHTNESDLRKAAAGRTTIDLLVTPAYRRLFPDLETAVRNTLSSGSQVQQSTTRRFLRLWMRTSLGRVRSPDPLSFVTGFSSGGRMIVFCGAGPGLLEDIDQVDVRRHRHSAVVICADTALAPVYASGIVPDLVVSVDAGAGTAYHCAAAAKLAGVAAISAIPCLTWTGGALSLSQFFDHIVYYRSTFPMDQLYSLGGALSEIPEWTNPTMNVAGLALRVAAACGQTRLLLLGTTFLSVGGVTHVRGTGYSLYAAQRTSRTWRPEMYAPGGYGPRLTQKNQAAAAGLDALAKTLGLELMRLNDGGDAASTLERWKASGRFEVHTKSIESAALAASLRNMRGKIDYETLARETGFGRTDIERWQKWIQSV